jgi:hypothetical protein
MAQPAGLCKTLVFATLHPRRQRRRLDFAATAGGEVSGNFHDFFTLAAIGALRMCEQAHQAILLGERLDAGQDLRASVY